MRVRPPNGEARGSVPVASPSVTRRYFREVVIAARAVLFRVFGSGVAELTPAVLVIFVPPATPSLIRTTSVIVAVAPEDKVPNVAVRLLFVPPHTPPFDAEQERKLTCAGRLSVKTTD
jgi:hypothetical protein